MDKAYQVAFIMDSMVVQTQVGGFDIDAEYNDTVIVHKANKLIRDEYGFEPLDLCYDYQIEEM